MNFSPRILVVAGAVACGGCQDSNSSVAEQELILTRAVPGMVIVWRSWLMVDTAVVCKDGPEPVLAFVNSDADTCPEAISRPAHEYAAEHAGEEIEVYYNAEPMFPSTSYLIRANYED